MSITTALSTSEPASTTSAAAKKKKPTKKELNTSAITKSSTTTSTSTSSRATGSGGGAGINNRGERMTFELDDVMRKYSPEQFKTCKAYDVGGVNILNKKPVDSKTALDKIKRRRETHNRVERRRRDCINQLIDELTALLPREDDGSLSKCHRVNVLRTAVAHIQNLTRQNENLKLQIDAIHEGKPMPPPAIITTLAPMLDLDEDFDDNQSYRSEPTSSAGTSYTSHAPRSPISPALSTGAYSPLSSPGGPLGPPPSSSGPGGSPYGTGYGEWRPSLTHLTPLNLPGPVDSENQQQQQQQQQRHPSLSNSGGESSSQQHLPNIPMIVEPSDHPPLTVDTRHHSKRMNRQTLPKLQLAPPPFHHHPQHHQQYQQQQPYQHHHRSSSGGSVSGAMGGPPSPSFYGHESASSPNSAYSGYSSSSAPWSSSPGPYSAAYSGTSSSFGGTTSPRSPNFSNYGPPSPYSPYGPSSAHAHMSRSPVLAPWNSSSSSAAGGPSVQGMSFSHSGGLAPPTSQPYHPSESEDVNMKIKSE
ncbi:hypothetical protein BGZ83_010053 [Gryganskiella cystojenkinii]|nr:hypothetical protein BGZ83_010053 [Gryganskiella cystojenkinii]